MNNNNLEKIDTDLDNYYNNKIIITSEERDKIVENSDSTLKIKITNILEDIISKINLKTLKVSKKNYKYIEDLLNKSKKIINTKTVDGDTLLHQMIFYGCYDIIKLLLKLGMSPLLEDDDKQTAIHRCIFLSNIDIVKLILSYCKNIIDEINKKDLDGNTPLHLAILIENYMIIKELLINGANPFIHNNANIMPIDLAKNNNKILELIYLSIT